MQTSVKRYLLSTVVGQFEQFLDVFSLGDDINSVQTVHRHVGDTKAAAKKEEQCREGECQPDVYTCLSSN